jgi:serine/threonine protein kinase
MGAVYQARQKQLDRIVALKILPPETAVGPGFAGRFAREARALAKLNHPHIVTLYEFGQTDGIYYFLMEYMDGLTLRQLLNLGRLSPAQALALVPQICDALQFAHNRGIVHRDIKPENLLLNKDGVIKIADFGVAKLIEPERGPGPGGEAENPASAGPGAGAGEPGPAFPLNPTGVIGTPNYMAPEQIEHPGMVDHRADIYSLGVVIYQMLTGELPGRNLEPPSKKVQMDVRLDEVVLRALEKNPELRYQQVSALKTEVETILNGLDKSSSKKVRRPMNEKMPVFIVIVVLLVAAGAVFTALTFWKSAGKSVYLPDLVATWTVTGKDPVGTNTATLTDISLVNGKMGRAFSLNGVTSHIKIPASGSLDVGKGDGFTLAAWINCTDLTHLNPIFEWNRGDGRTWEGVHFYAYSGGSLLGNVVDDSGNVFVHGFYSAPGLITPHVFCQVALTYDKTAGVEAMYLNGKLVAQRAIGNIKPSTSDDLYLGCRPPTQGETYHFSGTLEKPEVYDRALSAGEIQAAYTADLNSR